MAIVYLPPAVEPKANRYGADYTEEVMGERNPNSPRYKKIFEKAKHAFLTEFHDNSGGIVSNPTSAKAMTMFDAFDAVLFTGSDSEGEGWLSSRFKKFPALIMPLRARLKGAIINLAHLWLDASGDTKLAKKIDDYFGYTTNKQSKADAEEKEVLRRVNENRVKRAAIVGCIIAAVYSVFKMQYAELSKMIETAVKDIPTNQIGTGVFYKKFSRAIRPCVMTAYKNVDIESALRDLFRTASLVPTPEEVAAMAKEVSHPETRHKKAEDII